MTASDYEYIRRVGFAQSFCGSRTRGWVAVMAVIAVVAGATLGLMT